MLKGIIKYTALSIWGKNPLMDFFFAITLPHGKQLPENARLHSERLACGRFAGGGAAAGWHVYDGGRKRQIVSSRCVHFAGGNELRHVK